MEIFLNIAIGVVASVLGVVFTVIRQRRVSQTRAKTILADGEREAEDLKRNKLLEGREEALKITSDAEKQANQRLAKVQQAEARQKQRELQLNQQQSENARARNEIDGVRQQLDNQANALEMRGAEVEKLHRQALEELEHISGLSQQEAKDKLVESLKDEAKTAAASYINDIMDEAKMTANKEA
ncbi:MAG: Rnase Y domain-containing protein, partial [Muribaculaceae bacterium]|nr:Rnase Y domain-containing protein [Muribaculaceae bacterium]